VNVTPDGKARILMRSEPILKVLLNSMIMPIMKITKPADKQVFLLPSYLPFWYMMRSLAVSL